MSARDFEDWHLPHQGNAANDANIDAALLWNRELADAINCGEPEPGCTPEQQQAARDVCDWLAEHPFFCAVVAVAVIALTAVVSRHYPNGWWQ